jgi:hypothetical protein
MVPHRGVHVQANQELATFTSSRVPLPPPRPTVISSSKKEEVPKLSELI